MKPILFVLIGGWLCLWPESNQAQESSTKSSDAQWSQGLPASSNYFPIAVWLQNPRNAARFKAAGINLYVALWNGPTAEQLDQLERAGMGVICAQSRFALQHKDRRTIVGWMHGDEPDNAQSLGNGKGYGPPITPENIIREYEKMRSADPTRPVMLNLGQGVAWDNYIGRGVRRNHPEDYPRYIQGCDIVSFDIYPVVHDSPEIAGKLEYVAKGVSRLVDWGKGEKIVWNCIECTHISNPDAKASPAQIRAEVWMALIGGSRGLIYFVHQFKPVFKEAALLDDPKLLGAVTAINHQIQELAPVLNSPTVEEGVDVKVSPLAGATPGGQAGGISSSIACLEKRQGNAVYLFTVNLHDQPVRSSFTVLAAGKDGAGEVLGEQRRVQLKGGKFSDEFRPYDVHLYRIGSFK